METNVNYTIVGIFVITLITVIIVSVIWLSSGLSVEHYKTYKVYMTESVSGLSIDSPVEYNGVNVGAVTSIELNQKNPQLVELLFKIKSSTPITQGTVAMLNVKGLTGVAYISLQDKGIDTRPLVALEGQPYPIIRTSPSFFLRLDTAITKLNENLHQVSNSIRKLLDQQNLQSIKDTLLNLKQISGTLAANSAQFNTILHNTATASEQLKPLLKSSTNAMQVLAGETLPAANVAAENLATITNNLVSVSAAMKSNPAVLIRGKTPQAPGPGE